MTVLNINNMYITTIADSYVQINYSLSLSLSLCDHKTINSDTKQAFLAIFISLYLVTFIIVIC